MIDFIDVATIIKGEQYDKYGVPIKDNIDINVPCRIMYNLKNEELKISNGDYVVPKANVYFEGLYHVKSKDRFNFMDDFGVEHTVNILDVKPIKDFSGEILYTKVVI